MNLSIPALALLLALAARPTDAGGQDAGPAASRTVLVIHGGAGVLTPQEMQQAGQRREQYEAVLKEALTAGYRAMNREGKFGVDAVEEAIRVLEDSELFNAGRGAALNADGQAELDAAIMEGTSEGRGAGKADPRRRAGAVAGLRHVRNPISAARAVLEMPGARHVMLVGEGAERFALRPENRERYRIEEVNNVDFWTDRRVRQVRQEAGKKVGHPAQSGVRGPGADRRLGTVGAVALHGRGRLVAGTSTGGLTGKLPGRVGDTPVIGAGTYADDRACGVSCTGTGEVFLRNATAHDVVARMLYGGASAREAARAAVGDLPDEEGGVGGLIALDGQGRHTFAMSGRSVGMYRGYVTEAGEIFVGIYREEGERRMADAAGNGKLVEIEKVGLVTAGPRATPDGGITLRVQGSIARLHGVAADRPIGPALDHGPKERITAWAFSGDGRLVATGSEEEGRPDVDSAGAVRVWEVASGELMARYGLRGGAGAEFLGGVQALAFRPDGRGVLVQSKPLSGR